MKELKDFKVKLVISTELQAQILSTHAFYGKREWCGILFYKETSGSISDRNLELRAEKLYPLQVGSHSYVGGDNQDKYLDAMDFYPDFTDYKNGFLHTHHTMSAFFSGTDTEELEDQASNYYYFVSLIINLDGNYCAKISFTGEKPEEDFSYNTKFGKYRVELPKKVVFSVDCEISFEVKEGYTELLESLKPVETTRNLIQEPYKQNGSWNNPYENSAKDWKTPYKRDTLSTRQEGVQSEVQSLSFLNAEFALKSLLGCEQVNTLGIKFEKKDSLKTILEILELLGDEALEAYTTNVGEWEEIIIAEALQLDHRDIAYDNKIIKAYISCIEELIAQDKVIKEKNGFTRWFIGDMINDLARLYESDTEYEKVLKEKGFLAYVI